VRAIRKVTSRVIIATQDIPTGGGGKIPVPAQTEQYFKAPNLTLKVDHTAKYTVASGFDGRVAWAQDMNGQVTEAIRLEQARAARNADFYQNLALDHLFTPLNVQGVEKVGSRNTYVLIGFRAPIIQSGSISILRRACSCEKRVSYRRQSAAARSRSITATTGHGQRREDSVSDPHVSGRSAHRVGDALDDSCS